MATKHGILRDFADGMRPAWSGFSLGLGVVATVLVAGVILAARQFGAVGLFAGMGVLQAMLASAGSPLTVRPWAAFWFAAVGCATTALAGIVARDHFSAVAALAVVAFLAGCGGAIGPAPARMTNVLAIWFLTAVALLESEIDFYRPAVGFLCGSVAVFVLLELVRRVRGISVETVRPDWNEVRGRLAWGSPVLSFALVYALAGATALSIGWATMTEHRVWPAVTALILVRPSTRESLAMTLQRTAGTMLGAWAAMFIVERIGDWRLLAATVLIATFMMAATLKVNYAIFAFFLTAEVVALAVLAGHDVLQTGNDRIAGTLIGAGVALAATLTLRLAEPGRGVEAEQVAPA
jgi:hypothetical protein